MSGCRIPFGFSECPYRPTHRLIGDFNKPVVFLFSIQKTKEKILVYFTHIPLRLGIVFFLAPH